MKIFNLIKFIKETNQIGRFDYFKIIVGFSLFPLIFIILCTVTPSDKIFFPIAVLTLIVLALYLMIYWIAVYKRFNNIFDNKNLSVLFIIIFLVLSGVKYIPQILNYKPAIIIALVAMLFKFILDVVLLFVPGKQKTEPVFPTKYFWYLFVFILLIGIYLPQYGRSFNIVTGSMKNTLQIHDKIFVKSCDKNYERGDIILYKSGKGVWVSRIVGLPGENIEIKGHRVFINNSILNENYLTANGAPIECNSKMYCGPLVVPDNSYYVLGDNRGNSVDSRFFGSLDKNLIRGKVSHIYFPLNRRKVFKNIEYSYSKADVGEYMDKMQRAIKSGWHPSKHDKNAQIKVLFRILTDGEIVDAQILKSSGNEELDRTAIEAVENVGRLDPLPKSLAKSSKIDIEFTFDYNVHKR